MFFCFALLSSAAQLQKKNQTSEYHHTEVLTFEHLFYLPLPLQLNAIVIQKCGYFVADVECILKVSQGSVKVGQRCPLHPHWT